MFFHRSRTLACSSQARHENSCVGKHRCAHLGIGGNTCERLFCEGWQIFLHEMLCTRCDVYFCFQTRQRQHLAYPPGSNSLSAKAPNEIVQLIAGHWQHPHSEGSVTSICTTVSPCRRLTKMTILGCQASLANSFHDLGMRELHGLRKTRLRKLVPSTW